MNRQLRRALGFVLPYWPRLALVGALSLVSTAVSLTAPYLSKLLVDRALVGRDAAALYQVVALFTLATAGGFALTAVTGLVYTRMSAAVLFDMRLAVYRHLQTLSPRFYARAPLGDILARINNDIGEIQRVAAESLLAWVGNILFLAGSLAAMFWLDARLAAVGLALVPVSVWALSRARAALAARVKAVREAGAAVGNFLVETIQAVRLVVTANAQAREVDRFRRHNETFVAALMSMQWWSSLSGSIPGLILALGYAAVFLYGGRRVVEGTLTIGTFVAFLAYQMRLLQPVQALMGWYAGLATVQVSLARVHELLDQRPDVVDAEHPTPLPRVEGRIELRGVTCDLGRGVVLRDVTFAIGPGETVAIVGPSGSGKSTVADLAVRLLDPDRGAILLDGRDVRTIALADLRAHVVLVDQQPFVFHATIAENIRYARPDAPAAEVREAAHAAGLDRFIASLPDGDGTIVGERGSALSAGERQRIAIARALVADPDVLVLDEPSAALDPLSESRIVDVVERRRQRCRTTIVITHRPALAAIADRIFRIDGASVVEEATAAAWLG